MKTKVGTHLFPIFRRIGSDPRKYKVGFIKERGQQVVDSLFDDAQPFRYGLASVKQQRKWGAVDHQGKLKIQPVSDLPLRICEDRIIYEVDGRRGVMNLNAQTILAPKYSKIGEFHEGVAWMSSGGLYGFILPSGEELIPPFYEDARSFSEGLAPIELGGKWGFVNKSLKLEIPLQFQFALPLSEGLARVQEREVWGYINRKGEYAIAPQFEEAREFREGLAEVKLEGRWGYINQAGNFVIKPSFRRTGEFTEGLAAVEPFGDPERHVGFISKEGAYVILPHYLAVGTFRNGLCFVELADEIAYVDQKGNILWRGPFVDVGRVSEL